MLLAWTKSVKAVQRMYSTIAELENVEKIEMADAMNKIRVDVEQGGGGERRNDVVIDTTEEHQLPSGHGYAHMALKFAKDDKQPSNASVIDLSEDGSTCAFTAEDAESNQSVPVVALQCRGLVPVAYYPEGGWRVTSKGGTVFDNVDLSEREWNAYCEKLNDVVGVYNFQADWHTFKPQTNRKNKK